jgi:hypothetical protein
MALERNERPGLFTRVLIWMHFREARTRQVGKTKQLSFVLIHFVFIKEVLILLDSFISYWVTAGILNRHAIMICFSSNCSDFTSKSLLYTGY